MPQRFTKREWMLITLSIGEEVLRRNSENGISPRIASDALSEFSSDSAPALEPFKREVLLAGFGEPIISYHLHTMLTLKAGLYETRTVKLVGKRNAHRFKLTERGANQARELRLRFPAECTERLRQAFLNTFFDYRLTSMRSAKVKAELREEIRLWIAAQKTPQ